MTFPRLVDVPSHVHQGPPDARFGGAVDSHFRGLAPLNNREDPMIDIIAVTGLARYAFGSWRWREKPVDHAAAGSLPKDMTYGYDTTLN